MNVELHPDFKNQECSLYITTRAHSIIACHHYWTDVITPTRSNYSLKKIAINRLFWIVFQPLLNLFEHFLLGTCITNFKRIHEKLFKISCPQGQINWRKMQKIPINRSFLFSAVIELVRELLISNMRSKFQEDTVHAKLFKLMRLQG